ncbi:glutamate decarboxylase [Photobacterium phosphoreum]|uniref:glutamate decarboxylase n=1 Tax=Photobacterium phosphoreum TaxID=659 RepID=UPI0007F94FF2|nr:glutamate decarboxylase [Photobacterium phosphoreum]MCD9476218.1 glutamate decarboxylase [Photobacterium phosphoreum]MCD9480557.1 glutamate decarboxylase [Photobacterium phosphoreum]MCD9503613.1 glutamate decarboxylase [Photobacterium phosphoreum]MCD9512589.1 glutamate decarboxylase [Photobacterium phosphoreum]MCF2176887.1 glutamate decarboxylase [Photobacterium phosphoreum]
MALHEVNRQSGNDPIFGSEAINNVAATTKLPQQEQAPNVIYQMIRDELYLDGNSRQNLATFCQTWEEDEVHKLMDLSIDKNMIDKDEYPQSAEIEGRCVHMLADLWNSPESVTTVGTSTTGSSEACMLGGLAALWRWREKRRALGQPTDKPNMVCGPVQVCWEKFARYWDVEMRETKMDEGHYFMTPEDMLELVDANTIMVVPTFGQTFTGLYETVKPLSDALDTYEHDTGNSIDIHVDGASGAMLAPFCAPNIEPWDFRLERVKSISTSGHKFGLSPLGVGWVVWRNKEDLPEGLVFHVNYLGGDMPTFALNFSRPAGQIISQYYNFLRLGFEGYQRIHNASYDVCEYLVKELNKFNLFEFLFDGNREKGIPAISWRLKTDANVPFTLYDVADRLRTRGWLVPAYTLPANVQQIVVQRILAKQGLTIDLANLLIADFKRSIDFLTSHAASQCTAEDVKTFDHSGR